MKKKKLEKINFTPKYGSNNLQKYNPDVKAFNYLNSDDGNNLISKMENMFKELENKDITSD